MSEPSDSPTKTFLLREATAWIHRGRGERWPSGRTIEKAERDAFAGYFESSTLDAVRILMVDKLWNPPFYSQLDPAFVTSHAIDFEKMGGITFDDLVVVSRSSFNFQLLFHECVHVAQYKHLSVEGFMKCYLSGWSDEIGMNYEAVELEIEAYNLDKKFVGNPDTLFSVEETVRRRTLLS